jgi:phytoene dehydrogenase-like protein
MNIYDYIIIGAGIAGLSWGFRNFNENFLILEKNDYIGGRIKNIFWHEHNISLGAGVFLPTHDRIIDYCRSLGLETEETDSVYHIEELSGSKPNNPLYYKDFEIIYKSLVKKYYKNKDEIIKNSYTFGEFLQLFFPPNVYKTIKNYSLYNSFFDSDPKLFLENSFDYSCLRIHPTPILYIKKNKDKQSNNKTVSGYSHLVNLLVEKISEKKIKLNTKINKISQKDNLFVIESDSIKYYSKKIILSTDIKHEIIFDLMPEPQKILKSIYESIGSYPYIRIYSYHKEPHGLTCNYKISQELIGKTIVINSNILMIAYNEGSKAIELKNLLDGKDLQTQIDIISKLFKLSNVSISNPDDLYIKFWDVGMHYSKPNFNIKSQLYELSKYNIEILGELVNESHGWVESALETLDIKNKSKQ